MNDLNEFFGEPVFKYTSEEAEADGILINITKLNLRWDNCPFNYATANLMSQGYILKEKNGEQSEQIKLNIPNVLDLIHQAMEIVRRKSNNFTQPDTFFNGLIEFPDGSKQEIFIAINETGKFTLMLPEDY
jgi:hypothetical protein